LEALEELVNLKELKENSTHPYFPSEEYLQRKPIAWEKAKKAIEKR